MLNQIESLWASDFDLTHVADVKNASGSADGHMFSDGSCRILNRHIPSAEVNHFAALFPVSFVECGLLQLGVRHFAQTSVLFRSIAEKPVLTGISGIRRET